MKKITLVGIRLIMTLFCASMFAQGTGVNSLNSLTNSGIQNRTAANGNDLASVLVLGAPGNPDWLLDVEATLDNSGLVVADAFLSSVGTPTVAELMVYDAVFIFTDTGAADPVALGDNLAAYLEAGGAVVDATFTPNVPVTGNFTQYELYAGAGQTNGTNLGIGTILEPGHPTLSGVGSFDGGTASFHNTAGTVAAGAIIVAEYTTGAPLIIVQENVGPAFSRRAFLNFYPPSSDARDDFWDINSDGDILMANALVWAANLPDGDSPSVLIAGAPGNPDWLLDVEATLEGTGDFSSVDIFLTSSATPSLTSLQSYDAVYIFTDAGVADPVAFGDILEQYIDGGGAVLDATFSPNVSITGGFTQYELYAAAGQANGTNLEIGTILDPSHPTLAGVNTFDGGTASFHNIDGTVAAGATIIAEYTDGSPLVIVAEDIGPANVRRAFLNFFPPSINARDDFWDTASDGGLLMSNTIYWLLGLEELGINDIASESFKVFPNPATTQITIEGNFELASIEIFNLLGQKVMTSTSETLNVETLNSAVYLVKVTDTEGNSAVNRFIKK